MARAAERSLRPRLSGQDGPARASSWTRRRRPSNSPTTRRSSPAWRSFGSTMSTGKQETNGAVHRSPASPDTLVVPLRAHLPEGWYLIYWRAISVDGHPVQGAFTYAVGPNPGPAPQFRVPEHRGDVNHAAGADLTVGDVRGGDGGDRSVRDAARHRALPGETRRWGQASSAVGRVRGRGSAWVDRDPGVPGFLHGQRLAALGVRPDRARAAVSGDRVRPGDRRPRAHLCPVLPGGWDRPVGGSPRAGAAVDRGVVRLGRSAPGRGCGSGGAGRGRARGADRAAWPDAACSTGCTWPRARCGWAG